MVQGAKVLHSGTLRAMHFGNTLTFLESHQTIFLTIHVLSMAIGLGGATVSDLLFFKFLKDYRVSKKEEEVLHLLKDVILTAMFIITLSGLALYLPQASTLNESPLFLVKMAISFILIANGIALHVFIAPHLIHLNLRQSECMGRAWHRLAFALGAISICSWYSVFLIAMLKEALPFGFSTVFSAYLGLLLLAIACSQLAESLLTKKAGK